jgi:hypothetical protein
MDEKKKGWGGLHVAEDWDFAPRFEDWDFVVRFGLIGGDGIGGDGKSCLLRRFVDDNFGQFPGTTSYDINLRTVDIDGARVRLFIYDTASNVAARRLIAVPVKEFQSTMIIYDSTDEVRISNITWSSDLRPSPPHCQLQLQISSMQTVILSCSP